MWQFFFIATLCSSHNTVYNEIYAVTQMTPEVSIQKLKEPLIKIVNCRRLAF